MSVVRPVARTAALGGVLALTAVDLLAGPRRVSGPGALRWVNAHGAPFDPAWLASGRFETTTWARIAGRPGVRDAETTFEEDAADGLSVEWEVKGLRPLTTPAALDAAFAGLAAAARHAHAHGFTTILLARGRAARRRIPLRAQRYVTYVRGARPGLYATAPATTLPTTSESS